MRGALESGSLTNEVTVGGNQNLTLQEVPPHRVMGNVPSLSQLATCRWHVPGGNENEVLSLCDGAGRALRRQGSVRQRVEDFWKRVTP